MNIDEVKGYKGVIFIHLNIRSMLGKFDLFCHDFLDGSFDVVGLSETWMKPSLPNSLIMYPGYNLIRKDRNVDSSLSKPKHGGGLCLYLKAGISFEILTCYYLQMKIHWSEI